MSETNKPPLDLPLPTPRAHYFHPPPHPITSPFLPSLLPPPSPHYFPMSHYFLYSISPPAPLPPHYFPPPTTSPISTLLPWPRPFFTRPIAYFPPPTTSPISTLLPCPRPFFTRPIAYFPPVSFPAPLSPYRLITSPTHPIIAHHLTPPTFLFFFRFLYPHIRLLPPSPHCFPPPTQCKLKAIIITKGQ